MFTVISERWVGKSCLFSRVCEVALAKLANVFPTLPACMAFSEPFDFATPPFCVGGGSTMLQDRQDGFAKSDCAPARGRQTP
eukprot:s1923_g4.t1